MINHVLARLDNDLTPPGGIVWPTFTPRTFNDREAVVRVALIGANLGREQRFLRCLQLVSLVEESPLAPRLHRLDPRVTYDRAFVRDRLAPSGTVVQYTGTNLTPSALSLTVNEWTPEMASWLVSITGTNATVTDDLGNIEVTAFSFAGGITSDIDLPREAGRINLYGATPATGDSWEVSWKQAGASWLQAALIRMANVDVAALYDDELRRLARRSPVPLDRLAATVLAIGDLP